MRNYNVQLV